MPTPINPDNVRSVYVNNMEVTLSPLDARLSFNEIILQGGVTTVERRACIVMSLQHYQAMAQVLAGTVKKAANAQVDPSAKDEKV